MTEKYFIYEPDYSGVKFFSSREIWEKEVDGFDFLGRYCDDGWSDEVNHVLAGIIPDGIEYDEDAPEDEWEEERDFYERYATHEAEETILHTLDENGYDEEGKHWGEYTHISTYNFVKKVKS